MDTCGHMWRTVQYLMKLWRDLYLYSLQMILVTDTVDVKID